MITTTERLEQDILRYQVEANEKWEKWLDKIPYLEFPSDWKIKIVPPFAGAFIRFFIQKPGMSGDNRISVYLDVFGRLGGMVGGPYWEAYPIDGETCRFDMADTEELLAAIKNTK